LDHKMMNLKDEKDTKESIINIRRVAKVVKGGKRMSFSALIAIGTKDGKVGMGMGKANEVPEAIRKAKQQATKNLFSVKMKGTTIPHEVSARFKGAKVLMKPASKGTGVICGGAVRRILELSPISDILSKSLGSSNHINVATATMICLQNLKMFKEIADKRGKTKKEIYSGEVEG